MIALAIIVVILTYSQLWDPVNGCPNWACKKDVIIHLKHRVKYNDRLLACRYQPQPEDPCPCYNTEEDGADCLIIVDAAFGWCFRGECYGYYDYHSLKKAHGVNYNIPCKIPQDYTNFVSGASFGCKYTCKTKPHGLVNQPDGTYCWDPRNASSGHCKGGFCTKVHYS
ncbi:uncharacterized protein LOC135372722 [Ornithodoros turicata]|uniref:uncharacterized protein LOC135372722 n=1 Tax=Ornithodoros turicata TaxID=34597 RepID=UPI00313A19DE